MPELSDGVNELLAAGIDSVEAVEILLLLWRSANSFWTVEAISQRLGIPAKVAEANLTSLAGARLLERGVQTYSYRFSPADDGLRASVEELAEAYAVRRISVINAIYSANLARLRAFADAFKVKKS